MQWKNDCNWLQTYPSIQLPDPRCTNIDQNQPTICSLEVQVLCHQRKHKFPGPRIVFFRWSGFSSWSWIINIQVCDQPFVYHKFVLILVELTSPWTFYQRIRNWCDKIEQVQHHLYIYWYGILVNNMSICLNVTRTRLIRMPTSNIDTIEHANQCTSNIPMRPRCLVAE